MGKGDKITPRARKKEIGYVQGGKYSYRDKKITVAVIHSVGRRKYRPDFYKNFGTVVWDEAQVLGAESFSQTLKKFPAKYRIAMTAEVKRRDGMHKLVTNQFGNPAYSCSSKSEFCTIYKLPLDTDRPKFKTLKEDPDGGIDPKEYHAKLINYLTKKEGRNKELAGWVSELYGRRRNILAVSDRVGQLQEVKKLCNKEHGIPLDHMGLFVASYETGEKRITRAPATRYLRSAKEGAKIVYVDPEAVGEGADLRGKAVIVEEFCEKTGLVTCSIGSRLKRVATYHKKYILTKGPQLSDVSKGVKQEELDRIKKECPIILATYGMFDMAQDVPRLDAGIDLSPRAAARQVTGRIKRPMIGKPGVFWISPVDIKIERCNKMWDSRKTDYAKGDTVIKSIDRYEE